MSTTDAATAAITLTEDELDPYVTHCSTRRWLTGPGLPGDSGLFTFAELRRRGLRTVADSADRRRHRPGGGAAGPAGDRRTVGPGGLEAESVLLDGGTGEISHDAFLHDRPDLMGRRPLAPSLEALVRFARPPTNSPTLRGQFASYAGRLGRKAVAEASRQLLARVRGGHGRRGPAVLEDRGPDPPPVPGRRSRHGRSGLALDLPARLLDQEFGRAASSASRTSTSRPRSPTSRPAASCARRACPRTRSSSTSTRTFRCRRWRSTPRTTAVRPSSNSPPEPTT